MAHGRHGEIIHVEFPTDDPERAARFYDRLFGWGGISPMGVDDYFMWRRDAGPTRALSPRVRHFVQPRAYVQVDSIDVACESVLAEGGKVLCGREPYDEGSWYAFVCDPDGNVLGLFEGDVTLDA